MNPKNKIVFFIVLSFVLGLTTPPLYSAAWVPEAGHGQISWNMGWFQTSRILNPTSPLEDFRGANEFTKLELNPFLEYGLTSETAFIGNFFLQDMEFTNQTGTQTLTNSGIGNTEWGLRHRISSADAPQVWSVQALVKLPPLESDDQPRLGRDQVDVEAKLLTGRSFPWGEDLYSYWNLEMAYRHRTQEPGDEIRIDGTLGLRLNSSWMVMPQFFSIMNMNNGELVRLPNGNPTNNPEFDMYKAQLSVVYSLSPRFQIQFGGNYIFEGTNIGSGDGYLISLWQSF